MIKPTVITNISRLLRQYPEGCPCETLQIESGLSEEPFYTAVKALWNAGLLTGITEEGCCGNRCAVDCVAYMKTERIWKLAEYY